MQADSSCPQPSDGESLNKINMISIIPRSRPIDHDRTYGNCGILASRPRNISMEISSGLL
jgi:hypothetical protein